MWRARAAVSFIIVLLLKNSVPFLYFLSSGNHPLCADACSGHAPWYEYGFPSSVPIESVGSRGQGHTETDEFCFVDFEYVKEYAKLGLSFFVELADFA